MHCDATGEAPRTVCTEPLNRLGSVPVQQGVHLTAPSCTISPTVAGWYVQLRDSTATSLLLAGHFSASYNHCPIQVMHVGTIETWWYQADIRTAQASPCRSRRSKELHCHTCCMLAGTSQLRSNPKTPGIWISKKHSCQNRIATGAVDGPNALVRDVCSGRNGVMDRRRVATA